VDPRAGLQVLKERELLLSRESNDDRSVGSSYPVVVRLVLYRCFVDNLPALSTVIGIPIDEGSTAWRKTMMCGVRMVQEGQMKVILVLSVTRKAELLLVAHFCDFRAS
jgi:hypothetical protein